MLVFGSLSLASCASVTRGSTDAWVVNTDPVGAKVETTNGHQCPATPCAIKMPRKSVFTATITKPGYKPATVTVVHKTSGQGAAGMAGNVLVGGLIGIGVDAYTGATQDLVPNPVSIKLEREGEIATKPVAVETAGAAPQGASPQ